MIVTMRAKSGTAAQWTAANPVLGDGEIGINRDTGGFKIGNGTNTWSTLSYFLPGGVNEVVEYANVGALPATGEAGIMYVTLDTNKLYRWGGSTYVAVSDSPGSTDVVPEGSTNLYYTNARVTSLVGDPDTLVHAGTDLDLMAFDGVFLHVNIQNDGTDSAVWPNRLEFKYKPTVGTTVGEHLTAWFNEYGEFRVTPAKGNTVPFRAFTKELSTDAEHDPAVPVMEMVWARNVRTPIWGVMADGTMYTTGPIERRVPSGPTLKTGYLPLTVAASIPTNTPAGTLIVRY